MVALHTEWFPVSYDDAFYNKSVNGDIFTMAAVYNHSSGASSSSSSSSAVPDDECKSGLGPDTDLLGIVTMSTCCEHHCDDIIHVLGSDCQSTCRRPLHGKDGATEGSSRGALAYILTLGVVEGFRRRGLAKELLRRSVQHVDKNMPEVQAVYLHVVTYNEAAIQLYEGMRFARLERFNNFYNLHGSPYDSFLYAHYIHQGKPHWRVRLRNLLGFNFSWTDWVVSAWSSIWTPERKLEAQEVDRMTPP
jgi:ribosomal protein S18 acetylase RimI-like enzyme